ncbi:deoxyguanosinetriphosphate triphosphohydrolase family protein [Erythrobacter sp. QSSC1-22B]|uniref:deoxyguanosinetriphosphate triphosphohydrolase family protein n=1 Tax=Erythrobacter sp. QSSC1-22B TaxID=1860125 RepID=UPI00143B5218|nr:dNTP triphosphohydrolase [Erythrobacter sp. QSSC1-22B]
MTGTVENFCYLTGWLEAHFMGSLWSEYRIGKSANLKDDRLAHSGSTDRKEHRSAFQRDFDRLLFSSPVRRLADKTQVFPLEPNDSVRTRLTHSHEVANLARSIGARLHHQKHRFNVQGSDVSITEVLAILQSIGLAHDLGNPPFGHQGEKAIANWFNARKSILDQIPIRLHNEFIKFEGNAQTFRILTRLQQGVGNAGLDLTCGTLAALIKYPVPCDRTGSMPENKKYGFFESEIDSMNLIWKNTGLTEGQRHPLAWIMEAADDIAYSVLDVEDAIKKGIISPDDVRFILKSDVREYSGDVCALLKADFGHVDERKPVSVSESREIKTSYLRTRLIDQLIDEAVKSYQSQEVQIKSCDGALGLLDDSKLCKRLKKIAREHAFSSVEVTRVEANGAGAISELMSFFWHAIKSREDENILDSRRSEKAAYGWSLLSENYKEVGSKAFDNATPGMRTYYECRLLTDMLAGMTDSFTMNLHQTLNSEGNLRGLEHENA